MGYAIKREGLRESLAGNELFIHAESGDELLVLNRTALFVWSLCDDHDTAEMITVLEELLPDAGHEQLVADIETSMDLFVEKDLVRL